MPHPKYAFVILLSLLAMAFAPAADFPSVEEQVVEWVNAADAEELQAVKGIGKVLSAAIITARSGDKFATYDDIDAVKGIGPVMLKRIIAYVEDIDPD